MAWIRRGTISTATGSRRITGVGVAWQGHQVPARPGHMVIVQVPGGTELLEIARIISDTELETVEPWRLDPLTGSDYAIDTAMIDSPSEYAQRIAAMFAYYQAQLDNLGAMMAAEGQVTLTRPDGTQITVPSLSAVLHSVAASQEWFDTNLPLVEKAGQFAAEAKAGAQTATTKASETVAASAVAVAKAASATDAAAKAEGHETRAGEAAQTAIAKAGEAATASGTAVAKATIATDAADKAEGHETRAGEEAQTAIAKAGVAVDASAVAVAKATVAADAAAKAEGHETRAAAAAKKAEELVDQATGGSLLKEQNLADLPNPALAREHLDVPSMGELDQAVSTITLSSLGAASSDDVAPLKPASAATFVYTDGVLTGMTEQVDGKTRSTVYTYTAGRIETMVSTFDGVVSTTTYAYDPSGILTGFAVVEVPA